MYNSALWQTNLERGRRKVSIFFDPYLFLFTLDQSFLCVCMTRIIYCERSSRPQGTATIVLLLLLLQLRARFLRYIILAMEIFKKKHSTGLSSSFEIFFISAFLPAFLSFFLWVSFFCSSFCLVSDHSPRLVWKLQIFF